MTSHLFDRDRDIILECEADARPVSFDDVIADRIEQMDADAFECWREELYAAPEPPDLPPVDCVDVVDDREIPW